MFCNTAYQLSNPNNPSSERFFPESSQVDLTGVSGFSSSANWAHSPDQSLYSLVLPRKVLTGGTSAKLKSLFLWHERSRGEKKKEKKRRENPSQNNLLPLKTSPDFQALAFAFWCQTKKRGENRGEIFLMEIYNQVRACTRVCTADDWQRPALQQVFKGAVSYLAAILPEHASSLQGQIQQILPLQAFKKNKQAKQPPIATPFTSHLKWEKPHLMLARIGPHTTLNRKPCVKYQ